MNRKPPTEVRHALRQEVGFGCPIPGCASPYLEYHHFDPPWREEQHHRLEGMIALCSLHHPQADASTFTTEQLRQFKELPAAGVQGRFNWLRHSVLAVVGSNFYYEVPRLIRWRGQDIVWFNRDDTGHLLLNLRMLSASRDERMVLCDNDWIVRGNPTDFECPPSGRKIAVTYSNDDYMAIEFTELTSRAIAISRYPQLPPARLVKIEFPIVAVDVTIRVGGTPYGLTPTVTSFPNAGHISHAWFSNQPFGLWIA